MGCEAMGVARWLPIGLWLVMVFWGGSGCADSRGETLACEERRPAGFGVRCEGDGECSGYLKCLEGRCELPPTMSGVPESTTVTVAFGGRGSEQGARLRAEVAASALERSRGLSGRPCAQPGWGLLLSWPEAKVVEIQTEQMRYDLDLAFVEESGEVVQVERDVRAGQVDGVRAVSPVKYVLEAKSGELEGLEVGQEVVQEQWP